VFAADPPQTTVTLNRLIEKREVSLKKMPFSGWENGIDLSLHVDGPAVADARKFGKIKIIEASDDAGTDLTKKAKDAPSFESGEFQDIRGPMSFGFDDDKKKEPGFDIDVKLPTPAARSAKTIKLIKGELQVVAGGEKKVVTVKSLSKVYGKPIDDPALKAAGVTFTVLDPKKPGKDAIGFGDSSKSVPVLMTGKLDVIGDVQFVNKSGQKLGQGSMSMSNQPAEKKSVTYELSEPLSDEVTLQIEVWPGQKTVMVPITLANVKLP
jgi:hypothetical protein